MDSVKLPSRSVREHDKPFLLSNNHQYQEPKVGLKITVCIKSCAKQRDRVYLGTQVKLTIKIRIKTLTQIGFWKTEKS